ncbi:MAG: DUF1244 domain-containing protein [Methylococcaceae bacterium]
MNNTTRIEIEAATFRRLLNHLDSHKEVQNIELMLVADFCRNCLAKWYSAEAQEHGVEIDYPEAQARIYGMPYSEWKSLYQTVATPEQLHAYEERQLQKKLSTGSESQ